MIKIEKKRIKNTLFQDQSFLFNIFAISHGDMVSEYMVYAMVYAMVSECLW